MSQECWDVGAGAWTGWWHRGCHSRTQVWGHSEPAPAFLQLGAVLGVCSLSSSGFAPSPSSGGAAAPGERQEREKQRWLFLCSQGSILCFHSSHGLTVPDLAEPFPSPPEPAFPAGTDLGTCLEPWDQS